MKKTLSIIAALCGYGIFGFSFLFSKLALDITAPSVLLAFRFICAFLILNFILIIKKQKLSFRGKPVARLLFMGLLQPIIYFLCESHGIAKTTASFSGVMIGLAPVAGIIVGALFLAERPTVIQLICTLLSVIGVALTTAGGFGEFSLSGFLLLLGAVFSAAAFTATSKSISGDFTPFERTYVMFALGSVFFTAIALCENRPSELIRPIASPLFLAAVVYLALFSSVIAFLLINYAVAHLDTGHTLILSNITTVVSVIAGILILGDKFTLVQLIGVVLIILCVFGASYRRNKK